MAPTTFIALMLATGLGGPQGQQESQIPVFRVTSTRVVVEFIALDQQGHFVNDLSLGEIEIKVDGKKQDVDVLFPPGSMPPNLPLSLSAGEGTASPSPSPDASPTAAAASADLASARTAIVLDSRTLDASNFHHSVAAIREFIDESLAAHHSVMIAEIDRGLRIRAPFSRDKQALLAVVDTLKPSTVYNPLDLARKNRSQNSSQKTSGLPVRDPGDTLVADASAKNQATQFIDDLQQQIVDLRQSLRLLCYALSAMPGRKHVVFFSEGYPMDPLQQLEFGTRNRSAFKRSDERQAANRDVARLKDPGVLSMVHDIVSLANNFAVTFYTVDARGLVGVPGLAADVSGDSEFSAGRGHRFRLTRDRDEQISLATFKQTTIDDLANTQNTLLALAGGTNGSAFFNSNDLGAVLQASTLEQRNVYLASFVPKYKRANREQFRSIQVKSNRSDVLIRSEAGFLDGDLDRIQSQRLALAFDFPDLFRNLSPVIQVSQEGGQTQAVIGVPGNQITARPNGGQYELEIIFAGRIFDEKGNPVSNKFDIVKGFKLPLNREQMQSLAAQPLLAREILQLSSGKYRLTLAVEDRVSGALGIGSQEFFVP